jgi:hypothetical protein
MNISVTRIWQISFQRDIANIILGKGLYRDSGNPSQNDSWSDSSVLYYLQPSGDYSR